MRSYRRGPMIPAGVQMPYGGDTAPPGWLLLDGAAVSRSAYPRLFAVLGEAYGAGDGETTFALPDKRGRVSIGADGSHAKGAKSGADTQVPAVNNHTLALSQMPQHGHPLGYNNPGGSLTVSNQTASNGGGTGTVSGNRGSSGAHAHNADALNVHQPEEADNWIIKF